MKGDSYERFFNIGILYTGCYGQNLFCRWACRIIRRKGAVIVDGIGNLISMLDYVLDTKKKKAHYRRYSAERFLTLRRTGAYGNDYQKRGGRRK